MAFGRRLRAPLYSNELRPASRLISVSRPAVHADRHPVELAVSKMRTERFRRAPALRRNRHSDPLLLLLVCDALWPRLSWDRGIASFQHRMASQLANRGAKRACASTPWMPPPSVMHTQTAPTRLLCFLAVPLRPRCFLAHRSSRIMLVAGASRTQHKVEASLIRQPRRRVRPLPRGV